MTFIPMTDLIELQKQGSLLVVDDPYPTHNIPRWGYGKPIHPHLSHLFGKHAHRYISFLHDINLQAHRFIAISHGTNKS